MLSGIKVVELEGYLPLAFFGKILCDLGAESYIIKNASGNQLIEATSSLSSDKRKILLNLKDQKHIEVLRKMLMQSDVLVDGNRPGVLEKLGLDPKDLLKQNPRLIVARMTGYGLNGKLSLEPGHEVNYLGVGGLLEFYENKKDIVKPNLLLGDIFCGSLMPAFQVTQALLNREITGNGCVIDSNITTNVLMLTHLSNKFKSDYKDFFSVVTKNGKFFLFEKLNSAAEEDAFKVLSFTFAEQLTRLIEEKDNLITKIQEHVSQMETKDFFKILISSKKFLDSWRVVPLLSHLSLFEKFKEKGLVDNDLRSPPPFNLLVDSKKLPTLTKTNPDIKEVLQGFKIENELIDYVSSTQGLAKF